MASTINTTRGSNLEDIYVTYPVGGFGLRGKRGYGMDINGEVVNSLNEMRAI